MHKVSFPTVRDQLVGFVPGAHMSAEALIVQNISSREGYQYVFFAEGHASKMCWVFPKSTGKSKYILQYLRVLINETLPFLGIAMKHFHSDGGTKLVILTVLSILYSGSMTTSHSPRDALYELRYRAMGPLVKREDALHALCLSQPVAFWWLAVECDIYLLNRVPSVFGYMTPYECVHGVAPDLKWLCSEASCGPKNEYRRQGLLRVSGWICSAEYGEYTCSRVPHQTHTHVGT